MPLNEVEQHPYLTYFNSYHNGNVPWLQYKSMIIGSFPIYKITETIYPFNERRHLNPDLIMPFFYGSDTNGFWSFLADTLGYNDPLLGETPTQRVENAINMLEAENILLTDVVYRTNRFDNGKRNPYSPNDSALFNRAAEIDVLNQFLLNEDILSWLILCTNIEAIYFTAQGTIGKTPGRWFKQLLTNAGIQFEPFQETSNAVKYRININGHSRVIKLFFLPTPSSYRSLSFTANRRHPMFENYLASHYRQFYLELQDQGFICNENQRERLTTHRADFMRLWWIQYLKEKCVSFNGTRYV
ncbi:hypothetical protein [Mucilaginibacter sp.]|uniref:hypothetical protein n=1 Tax=Mucilaginibacter sp. TaxID=1882438 RepID=UPI00284394CA|nr:hypothetical protein [Mucilaginibacter sp.]MDR3695610.1 hypothetical protein [Mucilaginibacter sp.]